MPEGFHLNKKVVDDLLKSRGVQRDIGGRTRDIAAAAGEGMEATVEVGENRARGEVYTATWDARRREAESRALTRAADAGRR